MDFGEILGKTWKEYKKNISTILKGYALLLFLPSLIFTLVMLYYFPSYFSMNSSGTSINPEWFLSAGLIAFLFAFGVLSFLLSVWYTAGLICLGLGNKMLSLKQMLDAGKKYFWIFLGFSIVFGLAMLGLAILLIIPAIIFGVYWAFASYILIGENTGIIEAMRRSKKIVRGKWWRVFGYALLIILIVIGISLLLSLPQIMFTFVNEGFAQLLGFLGSAVAGAITTPLMILFFKNFYLDVKSSAGLQKEEKDKERVSKTRK